jgi:cytochrome d ubiquinol oxidase subunit I
VHLLTGIPVVLAGVASAFFVVTANAWMNQPRGFDLADGEVTGVRPWEAMFNPATPPQTVHMIVAAFMVAGFGIASVYAVGMLRGRRDRHHRLGFLVPFTAAAVCAPLQVVVGDWAAHFLAEYQPLKLAAIEGLARTTQGAPLSLGGVYRDGELHYAVEIPNALSLLAHWNPDAVVLGLDQAPAELQPPVNVVHLSFQVMVGIGFALVALGAWLAVCWWRRRDLPRSRWFLRAAVLAGPATVLAMEAGWVVTEVGRQPWVVYGVLLTRDAVNPQPGLVAGLGAVLVVYAALTVATVHVLRRLARRGPVPARVVAPQEPDTEDGAP